MLAICLSLTKHQSWAFAAGKIGISCLYFQKFSGTKKRLMPPCDNMTERATLVFFLERWLDLPKMSHSKTSSIGYLPPNGTSKDCYL